MEHLRLRIRSVDHDGYNGRDFPPETSDIGLTVVAVKMESWYFSETQTEPPVGDDGRFYLPSLPALFSRSERLDDGIEVMWTCVTADGRVLQLMGHELETAGDEVFQPVIGPDPRD